MALEIGSRLGHYDVTALIGQGGMGEVYRMRAPLNRDVVLKLLLDPFLSKGSSHDVLRGKGTSG